MMSTLLMITWPMKKTIACIPSPKDAGMQALPSSSWACWWGAGMNTAARIDAESAPYLQGVTVDYVVGLHKEGFKFVNPKATRTCGCGESFGV